MRYTRYPASTRRRAVSSPIPLLAPVTSTTGVLTDAALTFGSFLPIAYPP
ncbi:hypothetical protein [Streptantibioticus ferralitis]